MENTSRTETVVEIARLLDDHLGEDTIALDLGEMNSWTDYFVITTVRSSTHLGGLLRAVDEYLRDRSIKPLSRSGVSSDSGWVLVDCGFCVIHLMSAEMRDFFSLERLYFRGETVFHSSSKSS